MRSIAGAPFVLAEDHRAGLLETSHDGRIFGGFAFVS
jgi:hypothetical protein